MLHSMISSSWTWPTIKQWDNGQPNPNSLKRLVSASTRKTVRGAVAYFKDGSKQPIPVEIVIPPALLKEISTTATDKIAREQRKNKEQ